MCDMESGSPKAPSNIFKYSENAYIYSISTCIHAQWIEPELIGKVIIACMILMLLYSACAFTNIFTCTLQAGARFPLILRHTGVASPLLAIYHDPFERECMHRH